MIDVRCPKCAEMLTVPDSVAGQREKCPACGNVVVVPADSPPVTVPLAPRVPVVAATATPRPRGVNGLGVAALVLGIIACLTCWVPLIGLLALPTAALGGIFGLIGLLIAIIGRRSSVGFPVSGVIICIIAAWISLATSGVFARASALASSAVAAAEAKAEARAAQSMGGASAVDTDPVAPAGIPSARTTPRFQIDNYRFSWIVADTPTVQMTVTKSQDSTRVILAGGGCQVRLDGVSAERVGEALSLTDAHWAAAQAGEQRIERIAACDARVIYEIRNGTMGIVVQDLDGRRILLTIDEANKLRRYLVNACKMIAYVDRKISL